MFRSISAESRLNNTYLWWNIVIRILFLDDLERGRYTRVISTRMTDRTLFESRTERIFAKFSFVRLKLNMNEIENLRGRSIFNARHLKFSKNLRDTSDEKEAPLPQD